MSSNSFRVESVRLKLPRLPRAFSGLRAVQISDIHMGGWMNVDRLQQVVDGVRALTPDLLFITGDFLLGRGYESRSRKWLDDLSRVLAPLAALIPSFAVLGNHDYWTNPGAIREMLQRSAITDLTNSVFTLSRQYDHLHLCGVDDVRQGNVRLDKVIAQVPDHAAAILLAHEPDYAEISAVTGKFDLQLSGHTHGGQVVLPLLGPPILPRLGRKYPSGLYRVQDMWLYTNRGVGRNNPPIRLNCPAEITSFVFERGIKKAGHLSALARSWH